MKAPNICQTKPFRPSAEWHGKGALTSPHPKDPYGGLSVPYQNILRSDGAAAPTTIGRGVGHEHMYMAALPGPMHMHMFPPRTVRHMFRLQNAKNKV